MRRVEKEVKHAVLTANLVDHTTSGVLAGEVEIGEVEWSSSGVLAGKLFRHEAKLGLFAD